jgi:hypothetical protein
MPLDETTSEVGGIVPENNLRLPDALTIRHGQARLLSRFVLEGDRASGRRGIELHLRHDFDELRYLSRQPVAQRSQFRLMNMFNPEFAADLTPENSYWLAGEDQHGEIVLTQAGRLYHWPDSTLADEARLLFFGGRELGQHCIVTTDLAKVITGFAFYGGQGWVRPDFRGRQESRLFPRLGRAYAMARWPVDWAFSYVVPPLVAKGVAHGYGYRHLGRGIVYPDTQWGLIEVFVTALSAAEVYDDFTSFLVSDLSGSADAGAAGSSSRDRLLEDSVTRISSDGVFHGSSNLS